MGYRFDWKLAIKGTGQQIEDFVTWLKSEAFDWHHWNGARNQVANAQMYKGDGCLVLGQKWVNVHPQFKDVIDSIENYADDKGLSFAYCSIGEDFEIDQRASHDHKLSIHPNVEISKVAGIPGPEGDGN